MTRGFPIIIQYLFKKYDAFPYHQKQFSITKLAVLQKTKQTCVYMAKPLSGNRLQDKRTIAKEFSAVAWSHVSLIKNI
jgi:hypothetical protein